MAAILGLDDAAVLAACEVAAQGDVVSAVNFNSPGQVVIAGEGAAVTRALEFAKQAGAKRAVMLPVSVPSHCRFMQPAADRLAAYLENVQISAPAIPVIKNDDEAMTQDSHVIRAALVRQLVSPVRWEETIKSLARCGVATVVESGPGKLLPG